ncbi:FkbM family methyltransferase [Roseibium salinum]|nr:FkbM family methyltransferase [Roseibium salinum]
MGANIGLFCLRLRDLCPEARICALEPMPAAFAALRANAADMGGTVEIFNMALGSAPGKIEFEYCPGITALSSSEAGARKKPSRTVCALFSLALASAPISGRSSTGPAPRK